MKGNKMNFFEELEMLEKELDCEPLIIGVEHVWEGEGECSYDYIYSCDMCDKCYCKHHEDYEQYLSDKELDKVN